MIVEIEAETTSEALDVFAMTISIMANSGDPIRCEMTLFLLAGKSVVRCTLFANVGR